MLLRSTDGRREVRLANWLRSNPRNYSGSEVFYGQDAEKDDDDIKKLGERRFGQRQLFSEVQDEFHVSLVRGKVQQAN